MTRTEHMAATYVNKQLGSTRAANGLFPACINADTMKTWDRLEDPLGIYDKKNITLSAATPRLLVSMKRDGKETSDRRLEGLTESILVMGFSFPPRLSNIIGNSRQELFLPL